MKLEWFLGEKFQSLGLQNGNNGAATGWRDVRLIINRLLIILPGSTFKLGWMSCSLTHTHTLTRPVGPVLLKWCWCDLRPAAMLFSVLDNTIRDFSKSQSRRLAVPRQRWACGRCLMSAVAVRDYLLQIKDGSNLSHSPVFVCVCVRAC